MFNLHGQLCRRSRHKIEEIGVQHLFPLVERAEHQRVILIDGDAVGARACPAAVVGQVGVGKNGHSTLVIDHIHPPSPLYFDTKHTYIIIVVFLVFVKGFPDFSGIFLQFFSAEIPSGAFFLRILPHTL